MIRKGTIVCIYKKILGVVEGYKDRCNIVREYDITLKKHITTYYNAGLEIIKEPPK